MGKFIFSPVIQFLGLLTFVIILFVETDAAQVIQRATLILADNSIGMLQMVQNIQPKSLDIREINRFCEDIDAEVNFSVPPGTLITLCFKLYPMNNPDGISKLTIIKEGHYA
jgi:hypothetical protein